MEPRGLAITVNDLVFCGKGDQQDYGWYSERGVHLKDTYHKKAKALLKHLAENELGLKKDEYDLRSNKAGPASLGEVTLHTDKVYIQFGGLYNSILMRSCKGRKDYTGGSNNFFDLPRLRDDWDAFADKARTLAA